MDHKLLAINIHFHALACFAAVVITTTFLACSVIATDPDHPGWAQINSKLVQLTVQCSSPPTEQFCLEFEVSTIDAGK